MNERARRLAALMFTDIVGYSALAQRNEALSLDLLEEQRVLIRNLLPRHGGREIETIGDAFFVEFNGALEALLCAQEILKTLHERNASESPERAIRLRVGLHLGDVVQVGLNVHGDMVNIAARIQPLAEPEGICISEDLARQVMSDPQIKLIKLGQAKLKNIQLPMAVYRVVMPWEKNPSVITEQTKFKLKQKKVQQIMLVVKTVLVVGALGLAGLQI